MFLLALPLPGRNCSVYRARLKGALCSSTGRRQPVSRNHHTTAAATAGTHCVPGTGPSPTFTNTSNNFSGLRGQETPHGTGSRTGIVPLLQGVPNSPGIQPTSLSSPGTSDGSQPQKRRGEVATAQVEGEQEGAWRKPPGLFSQVLSICLSVPRMGPGLCR